MNPQKLVMRCWIRNWVTCVCFCASPETERSWQSSWPLRNIPQMTMDLFLLCRCFLSSITAKTFTGQDCIYEYHGGCLIRSRNYLLFVSTCVCPVFCLWSVFLIFLVFCVVLLCVFTFWVPYCDVRYYLHINTMFGSSLPLVVCRRAHVLLTFFAFVCE